MSNKDEKKIFSQAFPPKQRTKLKEHSKCHKLLINEKIDINKIEYRILTKEDINEVMNLHREWFPIKYEKSYIENTILDTTNYYSLCATYTIEKETEDIEIIVGVILLNYQPINYNFRKHTSDEIIQRLSDQITFYDNLYTYITFQDFYCGYIMTLGVIDEFRRMNVGSKLIEKAEIKCLENNLCLCLYLDVITYNTSAVNFYIKNNFENVTTIRNFYNINGTIYDSYVYVKPFSMKLKNTYNNNHSSFIFNYFGYYILFIIYIIFNVLTLNFGLRFLRKKNKLD